MKTFIGSVEVFFWAMWHWRAMCGSLQPNGTLKVVVVKIGDSNIVRGFKVWSWLGFIAHKIFNGVIKLSGVAHYKNVVTIDEMLTLQRIIIYDWYQWSHVNIITMYSVQPSKLSSHDFKWSRRVNLLMCHFLDWMQGGTIALIVGYFVIAWWLRQVIWQWQCVIMLWQNN